MKRKGDLVLIWKYRHFNEMEAETTEQGNAGDLEMVKLHGINFEMKLDFEMQMDFTMTYQI